MDNDLRQRLASAAATDPMVRDALKDLEWLEARPFEEFPAYWHSRLNDHIGAESWRNAAATHPLLKDAQSYEGQLIERTFAELEALAWHRGYVDSPARIEIPVDEVLAQARPRYPLVRQQQAYLHGFLEARKFLMVKAGIAECVQEFAHLAETKAAHDAWLQKLHAVVH